MFGNLGLVLYLEREQGGGHLGLMLSSCNRMRVCRASRTMDWPTELGEHPIAVLKCEVSEKLVIQRNTLDIELMIMWAG